MAPTHPAGYRSIRIKLPTLSLLAVLSALGTANAASFDCAKASSRIDVMICKSEKVSKLDSEMSVVYKNALAKSFSPNVLISGQRDWLKTTRNACGDEGCLVMAYQQRIESVLKFKDQVEEEEVDNAPGLESMQPMKEPGQSAKASRSSGSTNRETKSADRSPRDPLLLTKSQTETMDQLRLGRCAALIARNGHSEQAEKVMAFSNDRAVTRRAYVENYKLSGQNPTAAKLQAEDACSTTGMMNGVPDTRYANKLTPYEQTEMLGEKAPIQNANVAENSTKTETLNSGIPASGVEPKSDSQPKASWQRVQHQSHIDPLYFDPGTVTGKGQLRRVWWLTDYQKPRSNGVLSSAEQIEYDCERKLSRTMRIHYFQGNMGTGENTKVFEKDDPYGWSSEVQTFRSPTLAALCVREANPRLTSVDQPPKSTYAPQQRQLNCKEPANRYDVDVCKSAITVRLDQELSTLYYKSALVSNTPNAIVTEQEMWLNGRSRGGRASSQCGSWECFVPVYQNKIDQMKREKE